MFEKIIEIYKTIEKTDIGNNNLQPTFLYNEGWMLKLVLKWFFENKGNSYYLSMEKDSKWFSEALLSSKFLKEFRGDKLAESYTHADGVYGDFIIGENGIGDLYLKNNCKEFVVVEAKLFSRFSEGITNASNYNQAARNIACMCNIVVNSKQNPDKISFYAIIPNIQITEEPTFNKYLKIDHIKQTVLNRVTQYLNRENYMEKKQWYIDHFLPFCDKINVKLLSWEEIIEYIHKSDSKYGEELMKFYEYCIMYNRSIKK